MALKQNIKVIDNFGEEKEILNCYIRIYRVDCSKTELNYYIESKKDIQSDPFKLQYQNANYEINGENPFKQAYLHLKTLSEFSDAIDC